MRLRRGLGSGKTVSLDRVTLTSRRPGLTGRPGRLIRAGSSVIPEEWKSSHKLLLWHRAQMGVYFLLDEERFGVRPPYGNVVLGDGTPYRVEYDEKLPAWVLDLAEPIRAARSGVAEPILVSPKPGQCRPCGQKGHRG
jgi:CRISPR-associated exonuclease Cas4